MGCIGVDTPQYTVDIDWIAQIVNAVLQPYLAAGITLFQNNRQMIHLPFFDRALISNYKWDPNQLANSNFSAIKNKNTASTPKVETVFLRFLLELWLSTIIKMNL
jgi:hypothetical protein